MTLFSATLLIFAAVMTTAGCAALIFCRNERFLPILEKLPREKKAGAVLGVCVVFWCIPNLRPILDPGSFLQPLLIPLAVVAIVLAVMYLDYLFARSFAGFLILLAHYFLKEGHGANLFPWTAILAALLMIMGIAGIFVSAKPYYLRDYFRYLCRNKMIRILSAVYFILTGLSALLVFVLTFMK